MPIRIYGPSVYPERNAHKSITLWPDAGLVIQKETKKKKKILSRLLDAPFSQFYSSVLFFCLSLFFPLSFFFFFKFRCCRVEVIAKSEREEFLTGFN